MHASQLQEVKPSISAHGTATRTTQRKRGRPRSALAEQAILDATLELVAEVGIEALSIEGVAARAGVGKTTIYRRWASKEELIVAAVRRLQGEVPIVETGDLRDDLLTMAFTAEQGHARAALDRLFPRFLAEAVSNPALFRTYVAKTGEARMRQAIALIEHAQAQGTIRADLDPLVVLILYGGALMYGWLIVERLTTLPDDFVEQVVDTVWRGIQQTS